MKIPSTLSSRLLLFAPVLLLLALVACSAPPVLDEELNCYVPIDSCKPRSFDKVLIDTGFIAPDGYRYSIELLPSTVNSDANDHAISFYTQGAERVALVTTDKGHLGVQQVSVFNSPGYLPAEELGTLRVTNDKGAVGTATYSPADKKLYYTARGTTSDPSDYDVYQGSLGQADPSLWAGEKIGAIHLENVFDAQPAISPDGKRMYFASERLGATGGVDLWMSSRSSASGQWSAPQPLPTINTLCNELSPSVSYDGRWLYFASNGHPSVGGYDILRARLDQGGLPGATENIGKKVNTAYDELFPLQSSDSLLYYSSDQPAPYERRNLYVMRRARTSVTIATRTEREVEPEQPTQPVQPGNPNVRLEGNVVVAGDTGNVDAEVFWRDPQKDVELGRKPTDTEGNYTIDVPRGKDYDVGAESKDKFYDVRRVDTRNTKDSVIKVPTLVIGDTLVLRLNFPFDNYTMPYDFTVGDNGEQTPVRWQTHIDLIARSIKQDIGGLKHVVLFGHTDTVGTVEYNDKLAHERASFVKTELIKRGITAALIRVDHRGELHPLRKREEESLETYHLRLRRVEIIKVLK